MIRSQFVFVEEHNTVVLRVKDDVAIDHHLDLIMVLFRHLLDLFCNKVRILLVSRTSFLLCLEVEAEVFCELFSVYLFARRILFDCYLF